MKKHHQATLCLFLLIISSIAIALQLRKHITPLEDVTLIEATHSILFAPQYVALHMNCFADAGLNIHLKITPENQSATAAILQGEAQIALGSGEQTLRPESNQLVLFASLVERSGSFLAQRPRQEYFNWSHLKGQTIIGYAPDKLEQILLERVCEKNGLLSHQDIHFVHSPSPAAASFTYKIGNGAYLLLEEPTLSRLEQAQTAQCAVILAEHTKRLPCAVYQTTANYIQEQPKLLQKFTEALYRAQKWIQLHSAADIAQVIQPSFPDLDLDTLTVAVARYKELGIWSATPVIAPDAFANLQEILGTSVHQQPLINTTFAQKAVQRIR